MAAAHPAQIEQLASRLNLIEALLSHAGDRAIYDESLLAWLQELKGVAYDIDQVLDEGEDQLLRAKIHDEELPKLGDSPLSKFREISDRLEEISRKREVLRLSAAGDLRTHHLSFGRRPLESPALMGEGSEIDIQGREPDLRKLVDVLLMSDDCSKSSNLTVIPVVGMPGVGKTTLVQHVYNDPRVKQHFDLMGWVYVSIDFDVIRLTKDILECLTITACQPKELFALQNRLAEVLKGKRLLLVLDDVWNERVSFWTDLGAPLRYAGKGSVVVATTRSEITARIMGTVPFHRLECLSNDSCRAIFRHFAFRGLEFTDHEELIKIGEKIVRKCRGLPLAAKALGRILCGNSDAEIWEAVLQSETWQLDFGDGGMLSTLMPSYLFFAIIVEAMLCVLLLVPQRLLLSEG